ncbi:competence protein ComGF [Sinobaca qinghaiensis]|uniref:Competence protein ComGF n=1 Tax=Sinobaca qinghaiensis TaxID=342944 RepID=A0A419V3F4_9BACL|nr:ComGF family competence protein [Sinobaca qinghaiensis]RKD72982.1 competence protein ComGF [Sinobaca qinghaiensis]
MYTDKNSGFTLIETVLSLSITLIVIVLIIPLIGVFSSDVVKGRQDIPVFFQQLKTDFDYAHQLEVGNGRLVIKEPVDTRLYEQRGDRIVRRKNNEGFEIVLQNVENFHAEPREYGAYITVTEKNGRTWETAAGFRLSVIGRDDGWIKRVE